MKVRNMRQLFLAPVQRWTRTVDTMKTILENNGIFIMLLVALVLVQSQAFCDTASAISSLDNVATGVVAQIFQPWVKKTLLAFAAGMGMFQAYSSGSFVPLLIWGGLGLAANFLPKIIDLLGSLGS